MITHAWDVVLSYVHRVYKNLMIVGVKTKKNAAVLLLNLSNPIEALKFEKYNIL
jgi:hypothetical protein